MPLAVLLLVPVLALLAGALLLSRAARRKGAKAPPGPTPLPVVGSAHLIGRSPFVTFSRLADRYGDIYSIRLGSTECVVVSSLSTIKSVLNDNGRFFGGRPDFIRYNKLFGEDRQNSLALCDWCDLQVKRRNIARRHCNPRPMSPMKKTIADVGAFEMAELIPLLQRRSRVAETEGRDLELKPIIMSACLNMFSMYMCSVRFDAERDDEFARVVGLFDAIFWEINQGYAVDFLPWLLPFYSAHMNELASWSQSIRAFILARIVDQRECDIDDDEPERDFTDGLLKALKRETSFTRNAILFTLEDFLGGSSAVGNFAMMVLAFAAKRPEIAARIQDEIDRVTEGKRPVSVEDAERLPYTMATLKETLRYSSSPIVPHVAMERATVAGYEIEKGTVVVINNYKLNTSEELWERPADFLPERFLLVEPAGAGDGRRNSDPDSGVECDEESRESRKCSSSSGKPSRKKYSLKPDPPHFFPFSVGRRTCLGKGLVIHYGMLVVASVLQHFDVSSRNPEALRTYTACVALPPDTFPLRLTPRAR